MVSEVGKGSTFRFPTPKVELTLPRKWKCHRFVTFGPNLAEIFVARDISVRFGRYNGLSKRKDGVLYEHLQTTEL